MTIISDVAAALEASVNRLIDAKLAAIPTGDALDALIQGKIDENFQQLLAELQEQPEGEE